MSFSTEFSPVLVDIHDFGAISVGGGGESQIITCPADHFIRWFKTILSGNSSLGVNLRSDLRFGGVNFYRSSQRWADDNRQLVEFMVPPGVIFQGGIEEDFELNVISGGNDTDNASATTFYQLVKEKSYV